VELAESMFALLVPMKPRCAPLCRLRYNYLEWQVLDGASLLSAAVPPSGFGPRIGFNQLVKDLPWK
jgi:hypothetical protein